MGVGDAALDAVFDSPVGRIGIRLQDGTLARILFLSGKHTLLRARRSEARDIQRLIERYFQDPRTPVPDDWKMSGTPFQQRVWRDLQGIPPGSVLTYGQLAQRLDSGARAVGNACRCNPLPILVPCHRVVSQSGLGGFAGASCGRLFSIKCKLLQLEGVEIRAKRPHKAYIDY